jgi:hypothetical protein
MRFTTGLTLVFTAALSAAAPLAWSTAAWAEAEQRAPAAAPTELPADILALACAPTLAFEPPAMPLRVTGGQDSFQRWMHAPGDLITINAGERNGIAVGQEFYVRRVQSSVGEPVARATPATIRTAGWIRVYAVDEYLSLATITHACDTIEVDDYLEPFTVPAAVPTSADHPRPQRDNYGKVLTGQDRRRSFGRGDFFAVDRGSDHGVSVGTQFVLYRDKRIDGNFLYVLGEAVAVDVRPESSTLRVTVSADAIQTGDYAAMRR